ncbi:MAG: hypothetical protein ACI8RP_000318 [Urechidicola sp.]|jgi:hypothetical protein
MSKNSATIFVYYTKNTNLDWRDVHNEARQQL